MDITTHEGEGRSAADLDLALAEIERGREDAFAIAQRADGVFLQAAPFRLERGDGTQHFRATSSPPVREVFAAFLEGRPDWDASILWVDVTREVLGPARPFVIGDEPTWVKWTFFAAMLGALGFAAWKLLPWLLR